MERGHLRADWSMNIDSQTAISALALLRNVSLGRSYGLGGAGADFTAAQSGAPTVAQPAGIANTAKGTLASDLFSATHRGATQIKMQLFEAVGEQFGIDSEDFTDFRDFAKAVRSEFGKLQIHENSAAIIRSIESELGLDELGVSLADAVAAMSDPSGDNDHKLTEAIEREYEIADHAKSAGQGPQAHIDEIAIYSVR